MYKLLDLDKNAVFKGYVPFTIKGKNKINILALGDVGGTLLTGLKLMGGDVIESIGIFDMNKKMSSRYEMEMNQIAFPFDSTTLPKVKVIAEEDLFDCDIFVFCASKAVPSLNENIQDVRMVQFEENKKIVDIYAKRAGEENFKGLFAVVSDPVDPLCKSAYLAAKGKILAEQIHGYGLGVMNSRAMYYAKKDSRYESYIKEGRAFGPHGQDLVIANSILNYDEITSKELTKLTVESNLEIRELGFKPYIAPALSSAAISILLTLRGEWHYSSNFIGKENEGAYMGALNRITEKGLEFEDIFLPEKLFVRINKAYENLKTII